MSKHSSITRIRISIQRQRRHLRKSMPLMRFWAIPRRESNTWLEGWGVFSATMIKKTEDFTLNSVFLREEFDLDDLFNLFFEQNTRTRARRFNTRSQQQAHQQNPQFSLLSLLPIIFMLMFFMGLFMSVFTCVNVHRPFGWRIYFSEET